MKSLGVYKKPITDFLSDYLQDQTASIYAPVHYVMSLGAKRMRPCICMAVAEGYGCVLSESVSAAAAIEVFHNFTLLHDDIMDDANQRRGKPAVHVKWNSAQAILSGDIMFAMSYELLAKVDSRHYTELSVLFTETAKQVCEGQQLDMEFESREEVGEEEYLEMIRLKTSVLVGAASAMGAVMGGATQEQRQAAYDFGLNLGLSFQIQDDILDAFGEQARVGKQIGGDILQNKKTLLYIRSLTLATPTEREELKSWYSTEGFSQEKVAAVKEIMKSTGALDSLRQTQAEYQELAANQLAQMGLSTQQEGMLSVLLEEQLQRSF